MVKYTILLFDLSQKVSPYPHISILEMLSAHMKPPYIKKLENKIRDFYQAQNPLKVSKLVDFILLMQENLKAKTNNSWRITPAMPYVHCMLGCFFLS